MTAQLNIPQVSYGCASPGLSNTRLYPTFARTVGPSMLGSSAWAAFFKTHNFHKVDKPSHSTPT